MSENEQAVTLEDLFNAYVDDKLTREANAPKTVPTGAYRLDITKVTAVDDDGAPLVASERSPWPGRPVVSVRGKLTDEKANSSTTTYFDLSYVEGRNDKGKLDRPSKLWGQFVKASGSEGKTNREVTEAIAQYPYRAFVTEAFQAEEGGAYLSADTEADRQAFFKDGYVARNFVQTVSAYKG